MIETLLVMSSRASSLVVIAWWTLVYIDMLSPSRGDIHTFRMEPPLTNVAENPEFIRAILLTACTIWVFSVFIFIFLKKFFHLWWACVMNFSYRTKVLLRNWEREMGLASLIKISRIIQSTYIILIIFLMLLDWSHPFYQLLTDILVIKLL